MGVAGTYSMATAAHDINITSIPAGLPAGYSGDRKIECPAESVE
jgi:hypothetical protein